MGEDGDLQFGVPYRLPPRIAPGIHAVLLPNTGNPYFSPGRGAVPAWPRVGLRRYATSGCRGGQDPYGPFLYGFSATLPGLIGGKGVTLASWRAGQRARGSSRSRARTCWTYSKLIVVYRCNNIYLLIKPTSENISSYSILTLYTSD